MRQARHGSDIEFPSGGETGRGYLALPPRGRGRGVLVLQEWWGLVDHIRDVVDRLAEAGFVALAPDLYRGETASDPDTAGRLMMGLEIPRAARDLSGAVEALLNHAAVDGGRVGAIGFCMGGQLALYAATLDPRIAAVVDFYGIHPNVNLDFSGLRASVLGIFAERDGFVPPSVVHRLEADLAAAGVRTTCKIFPGVDHAFMNDTRPDVYNAAVAAEAWQDAMHFLHAELGA